MYLACDPGALGFSLSFIECVDAVAAAGYQGYWFNLGRDSAVSAAETGELLARHKLRPAGFGLPVDVEAEEGVFKEGLAKLRNYGPFIREAGLERTATWIPPASEALEYKANFELHRARFKETAKVLGDYGVSLGLEFVGTPSFRKNGKYPFIYGLDGALELIGAVGEPNLGLLLDLWHWDMAGHTRKDFEKLQSEKQIVLAHLNDAPPGISREEQIDTVRRLPGATGVLGARDFVEGLRRLGYQGPVAVEPFDPALKEMPFARAAQTASDAARKVL